MESKCPYMLTNIIYYICIICWTFNEVI
jgi:hypothetical protein